MKIVSACLAGVKCRYDCQSKAREEIINLVEQGKAIPVCPEQLGGLSTPRPPAEVIGDKVLDINGNDLTEHFLKGATEAYQILKLVKSREAYLKTDSPMCGVGHIYDGSFSGTLAKGDGIFTRLLKKNGIKTIPIK